MIMKLLKKILPKRDKSPIIKIKFVRNPMGSLDATVEGGEYNYLIKYIRDKHPEFLPLLTKRSLPNDLVFHSFGFILGRMHYGHLLESNIDYSPKYKTREFEVVWRMGFIEERISDIYYECDSCQEITSQYYEKTIQVLDKIKDEYICRNCKIDGGRFLYTEEEWLIAHIEIHTTEIVD